VDVIGNAANRDRPGFQLSRDAGEVRVDPGSDFIGE